MYAYHTRYEHKGENVEKVVLIYPFTDNYKEIKFSSSKADMDDNSEVKIEVRFINLLDEDKLPERIKEIVEMGVKDNWVE